MNDINHLIEKYYDGSTSLEEEKRLREYFSEHPQEEDGMIFTALGECPDFGAMAEKASAKEREKKEDSSRFLRPTFRRWWAAASIALLLGVGISLTLGHHSPVAQATEPEAEISLAEATEHTRKALTLFANAVNRSRESVSRVERTVTEMDD